MSRFDNGPKKVIIMPTPLVKVRQRSNLIERILVWHAHNTTFYPHPPKR